MDEPPWPARSIQRRTTKAHHAFVRLLAQRLGPASSVRARESLSRTRHGHGSDLTPTERRVAELAASGLTNREVAERAFISPKTVEANLARVYHKLAISSRAGLGARFAAAAPTHNPPSR